MLRVLLSTFAFAVGFALVCVGLHTLTPFPQVPQVREKLEFFTENRDRFDTLFLGSSRVYRQISPELFDAEMRAHGGETRSFNFGIDAMTSPELLYVFDRILEGQPKRLRHIVIDLNQLRRRPRGEQDPDGLRSIYWHNFEYTALVLSAVWHDSKTPPEEKRKLMWAHAVMLLKKYVNVGDGTQLLPSTTRIRKRERHSSVLGSATDGFVPRDLEMPESILDDYNRTLAARLPKERVVSRDPILEKALANFARKVESLGARAYFLVSPTVASPIVLGPGRVPWSSGGAKEPVLLHFDDPNRFPELFDSRHRFDMEHLNKAGAIVFTRLLAEFLAPQMEGALVEQELNDAR